MVVAVRVEASSERAKVVAVGSGRVECERADYVGGADDGGGAGDGDAVVAMAEAMEVAMAEVIEVVLTATAR